ncbi:MAG: CPBP family intramembrane metalloprotease [Deltaproteobacteria bacterium]|nr:CPBP family intramembrane metalloprotease [Deltaproteobacteria bacterium]
MAEAGKPPEHERLIDLVLAAVTLIIAGLLMFAEVSAVTAPSEIGVAAVRAIEDEGMTLDADQGLAASTQVAIGLEGKAGASPPVVMAKLRDEIRNAFPESIVARLVWSSMAASFRLDAQAQAELAELAHDKRAEGHRKTIDALADLASGRAAPSLPELEATMSKLGISRWLVERLRERQAHNLGDEARRQALAARAVELADGAMSRRAVSGAVQLGLVGLGLFVVVIFPWFVRPRLAAGGHPGLETPSPFRLDRTRRVMLAWFLAYVLVAALLPPLFSSFMPIDGTTEAGLQALAILLALQGLAHGAAGVGFIRLWGRRPDDHAPLGPQLGLTTRPLPRRFLGLAAWTLPALAVVFVLTVAAIILTTFLFGPIRGNQIALQVIVSDARPETFVLIAIGAALIAPVMEEILFRGFLFRNLRDTVGRTPALFLSGLVFAVVHREPALLVPLMAMGVALALLYEWSGSLLVPIAAHAAWNLVQLVEARLQFQV